MSKSNKNNQVAVVEVPVAAEVKTPPTVSKLEGMGHKTTSAKIRFLDSDGFTRSQIAKHLQIRYQHVRNVLTQPLKKVESAPVAQTETSPGTTA